MSEKSVLITGAAGFIGSHLTERCLSLNWRVIGVDAFTDYYAKSLKEENTKSFAEHPNCTFIEGDLLDLDLDRLLDGVAIVFHLAAQPGVPASWTGFRDYTSRTVDATQRLLHAASSAALDRFIFASSSSVYGNAPQFPTPEDAALRPLSPYGVTKVAGENLAQAYWLNLDLPAVSLRYFSVYGPRQRPDMAFNRLIASALEQRPFQVFGDGAQTRDFTFVSDVVGATLAVAQRGRPGSVYNIGGGSRRSINSVFEVLGELLGRPIGRRYRPQQLGDARDTGADITRARDELGFEPSFDFPAGLGAQLDWQRAAAGTAPDRS
jgi:UDP-glucose 4-epimerase